MSHKYCHHIERHNLQRGVSYLPVGATTDPQYAHYHVGKPFTDPKCFTEIRNEQGELVGWSQTFLQELTEMHVMGKRWYGRRDILLYSGPDGRCDHCGQAMSNQMVVEPGPNGTLVGDVAYIPTQEDYLWALEESKKCWQVALDNPVFMAAFYG